jgi:hypothetical protein
MKKSSLLLSCAILGASFLSHAQESQQSNMPLHLRSKAPRQRESRPYVYIGTSTGINNQSGILGVNLDVSILDHLSVGVGGGLSSWGNKLYAEARYYFNPANRGLAFGAGVTNNSGIIGFRGQVKTEDNPNEHEVPMDLKPQTNGFVSAYYFFNLGKRYNRLFLQAGWSVPFAPAGYTVKTQEVLTDEYDKAVKMASPGGLILGVGFSFAIGGSSR